MLPKYSKPAMTELSFQKSWHLSPKTIASPIKSQPSRLQGKSYRDQVTSLIHA